MDLCDELQARLTENAATRRRLLEAVLVGVLGDNE